MTRLPEVQRMIIKLLQPPTQATAAQLALYQLLVEHRDQQTNLSELQQRLQLRSVLPLRARLNHLAQQGAIAIL